jgi:hypothetical protein
MDTDRMGPTSIRMPEVDERPAKQCPPLRATVGIPSRRASAIVSTRSSGTLQSTAARGRTSSNCAQAGLRTSL